MNFALWRNRKCEKQRFELIVFGKVDQRMNEGEREYTAEVYIKESLKSRTVFNNKEDLL